MRSFDKIALEEIRRRIVLSELIGEVVKLTRRGREHVGLSPFSEEKTASFTVTDEKRFWHCFSSKRHGDCFNWLMEHRGLSFPDAVRELAERTGVNVDQQNAKPERQRGEISTGAMLKALAVAADIWREDLAAPIGADGRAYLAGRGIQEESLKAFGLGWCGGDGAGFADRLAAAGADLQAAYRAGLLSSLRPARLSFENRIVFPIRDARGRVLGFGGRTLDDGEGPKYINSRETPLFHKHRCFFGLDKALAPAHKRKRVIVVEGYIDAIAMAQAGFPETVAGQGSSVDLAALDRAFPFVQRRYFLLDGDASGEGGSDRLVDQALASTQAGKVYLFTPMPAGHDPDSLLAGAGAEIVGGLLDDQSFDLPEALWRRSLRRLAGLGLDEGRPEAIVGLIDELGAAIATISDLRLRAWYESYMAGRIEVTYGPKRSLAQIRAEFA